MNKKTASKPDVAINLGDLESDPGLTFKYIAQISLEGLEIIDIEPEYLENAFALKEIKSNVIVAVFSAESQKSKNNFLNDIDDAIWKRLQASRSLGLGNLEEEKIVNYNSTDMLYKGPLHKQTRKGEWKLKFCQLVGTEFCFLDNDGEVTRVISILKANITLWPVMDRPYCFAIGVTRGCFYFSATTGVERMTWINVLRSAMRKHLQHIKDSAPQKLSSSSLDIASIAAKIALPKDKLTDNLKKKKTKNLTSKKYIKSGILYKEYEQSKFKKYNAMLKEDCLVLEKDKKDQVTFELLLLHTVSPVIKEEVKPKEPAHSLFVIEIVSDQRRDKLGADNKEDLEDWISLIKSAQIELGKSAPKKKKK